MKSTDIIQPVAMATPVAISGSKDEIPQEQANVQLPWYCSIEQGFPDITMTALNQGGRPPRGQGMNGLLNLISDQKVYLQNGGILTFNQSVSDTIGGYPQGAILDYVQNNTYAKVISLVDNNTVDFTVNGADGINWQLLDFGGGDVGENANTDLSNLTANGNAKFQYAPFSINNGIVDSGENATLQTVGDVPVSVDRYVVPELSANESEYGTCNNYAFTSSYGNYDTFTMTFSDNNRMPAGAIATFSLSSSYHAYNYAAGSYYYYYGLRGCKITYIYTDDTTEVMYHKEDWGEATTTGYVKTFEETLGAASKEVKGIEVYTYPVSANQPTYRDGGMFRLSAKYTASSADTLICNPCTITTCDNRTKSFEYDNVLDCSSFSDGDYKVYKDVTTGELSVDTLMWNTDGATPLSVYPIERVGNLSLSQKGILSGFSLSNYATFFNPPYDLYSAVSTADSWDIVFKIKYKKTEQSQRIWSNGAAYISGLAIYSTGKLLLQLRASAESEDFVLITSVTEMTDGEVYYVKASFTGTEYILSLSQDGINYNIEGSVASTTKFTRNEGYYIGYANSPDYEAPLSSTIDLTGSYININGNRFWAGEAQNDKVYVGDITVANGVITAVKNNYFNACPAFRYIVDSYEDGTSWYEIYSDGWCEQGAVIDNSDSTGPGQRTITLLKPYKDTNYNVLTTCTFVETYNIGVQWAGWLRSKTTNNFVINKDNAAFISHYTWRTCGYVK